MSNAEYQGQQIVYFLDYKIPGADSERIPIIDTLTVGSAEDVEVSVDDFGLAPRHGIFRVHNDILSIHNLAGEDNSFIGKQALTHGRMYIIDKGDKVSLGDLEFIVRTEEVNDQQAFLKAVGIEGSEISVADILSHSKEDLTEESDEKKSNFFKAFITKLKGMFKKKTLADDVDPDMSLPSGVKQHSKGELLLSQMKSRKKTVQNFDKKSGKSKSKSSYFSQIEGAKTIHRLFALILNLLILQSFYLVYGPHFKLDKYYKIAADEALKYISLGLKMITAHVPKEYVKYLDVFTNEQYVTIVVIYLALGLISCLIFGVNFGQLLVRISSPGSFIGKRIKGMIRTLIGIFTAPFLVFDLPAIVGNKTLKEALSGSQIGHVNESAKALGTFIFFPAFLGILLLSPLFLEPEFLSFPTITQEFPNIEKSKNVDYKAESYLLNAKINALKFDNLLFIPELNQMNKKSVSKISLFNTKKNTFATLSIEKMQLKYKQLAKKGLTGNFLASLFYPALTSQQSSLLGVDATLELEKLFVNSYRIVPDEAISLLKNNGPFLVGIAKLREMIRNDYFVKHPSKIAFMRKDKHTMIALGDSQDLSLIYLLNPQHPLMIKLEFKPTSNSVGEKLYILALKSTQLIDSNTRKKSSFSKKLKSRLQWNAFDVLDLYSFLESIPKQIDPIFISRYAKFMKDLGKGILNSGNKVLINSLLTSQQNTEKALKQLRVPNSERLLKLINEQITALKTRNLNYFK